MTDKPFDHPNAKSFEYRSETGADGKPILILEVGTDLKGAGWSETEAGQSLQAAVDEYICGPTCRALRVDILPNP